MIWKNRYVKWGLTAFCTVGAILLFYDTLFGSHTLVAFARKLMGATKPVLYGAFMAYLLAPVVNFFEIRPFASVSRKPLPRPSSRTFWILPTTLSTKPTPSAMPRWPTTLPISSATIPRNTWPLC